MAILLKELTIRYSPQGGTFTQLVRDYYAMFSLWRNEGSGGSNVSPTGQRKTEVIDDVLEQIITRIAERFNRQFEFDDVQRKNLQQMNHAFKTKNWLDFHAAVEPMFKAFGPGWFRDVKKMEMNPKDHVSSLSPSIKNFVQSSPGLPDAPKKPEPIGLVKPWNGLGPDPSKASLKALDKPLTAPPAEIPRELPMAGNQMHLPLKPREKLPPMPDNLPPLQKPFAGREPKRLGGNWETVLANYGYNWSEPDNAYKNEKREVMFQVQPNNSVKVFLPSGGTKNFANIGLILRRLAHNRKKRHAGKAGEPQAQVTEENYKMLYEFLYT